MTTPTQRSLNLMRKAGFHVEVVEHWNSWTMTRKDMLGFADILALHVDHPPTLLQVTSTGVSARIHKIINLEVKTPRGYVATPRLALQCGFRILVHGWRHLIDLDAHGTNERSWQCRVHVVSLAKNGTYLVDDKKYPTV